MKVAAHLASGQPSIQGISPAAASRKGRDAQSALSLMQAAVAGPLLSVQPGDAAIQVGKEVKLVVVDERLRASGESVFRLEFDPSILQFKRLGDAEVVDSSDPAAEAGREGTGAVAFRLARPERRAPRSVTVTFLATAPGVSPIRVELAHPAGESQVSASEVGTGVVRVR
jgi:general secretion pathway protein D